MADGYLLYLVLWLLYLWECARWVGRSAVVFERPWLRGWVARRGSRVFGSSSGGFVLGNPFPPGGVQFPTHPDPICLSPIGIVPFEFGAIGRGEYDRRSEPFIAFSEMNQVTYEGRAIVVNGKEVASCQSVMQAVKITHLIQNLVASPIDVREVLIRAHFNRTFDEGVLQKSVERFRRESRLLMSVCSLHFILLFVVLPILCNRWGLAFTFFPAVAVLIPCSIVTAVLSYRAQREMGEITVSERIQSAIIMSLYPLSAIRANDQLAWHVLADVHPIAGLATLTKKPDGDSLLRELINDMRFPLLARVDSEGARQVVEWYSSALLGTTSNFIRVRTSTIWESVFDPKIDAAPGTSYCPRCLCQFGPAAEACPDCPGIPLVIVSESVAMAQGRT